MDAYYITVMVRTNDKLLRVITALCPATVSEIIGEIDKVMNIFTITGLYFVKYVPVSLERKAEGLIITPRFSATEYNDYCTAVL
jgi:hypothetical protein